MQQQQIPQRRKRDVIANILVITYTYIFVALLIVLAIVGYVNNVSLLVAGTFALNFYGVFNFVHVILQMYLAARNMQIVEDRERRAIAAINAGTFSPTAIMVAVGFREGEKELRDQFASVKNLKSRHRQHALEKFIFVSEGNEEELDWLQERIFREAFIDPYLKKPTDPGYEEGDPIGYVLPLPFVLYTATEGERTWFFEQIARLRHDPRIQCIFISQPHFDKRRGMFTGFMGALEHPETIPLTYDVVFDALEYAGDVTAIITTDSDTKFEEYSIDHLLYQFIDEDIGVVSGMVRIANITKDDGGSIMTRTQDARYVTAFLLERGAQSAAHGRPGMPGRGKVNCASGPFSAYRPRVFRKVMGSWANQTFFGHLATRGDDRKLTNDALHVDENVVLTHKAICYTDAPPTFWAWWWQQYRWKGSFLREAGQNFLWLWRCGIWLTFDLTYQTVFPILLSFSIILATLRVILTLNPLIMAFFAVTIVTAGLIRAIFAYIATRGDNNVWWLSLYGFLYIPLLGALFWAMATIAATKWSGRVRGAIVTQADKHTDSTLEP